MRRTTRARPATGQAPADLVIEGLGVAYGDVSALGDVHATARAGEVTAVTGHSGAGKTSLLWAVGGLLAPDRTDGTVSLGARTLEDEESARAAGAVLIPQGSALAEVLTARDNVTVPLLAAGTAGADAMRRADEALAAVGLGEHGSHLAEELSGGQRQRVAVARGLALASLRLDEGGVLLLADEPTSELDHDTRERVVALLQEVARRGGIVLLATHDPEVAEVAHAVWRLDDGHLTPATA
ncbi:ATP-binding cassette domain-containing protein [Janibacter cremeus]|uniref:ABC transporter ATP-binding protein n=1 Tax=Janibacter cremeus TaxID=1285192 RepID=UPI0023F96269|nr:ATP-binding cassette domain-containing protein [Janibacter cremeus]WEV77090.1 ATP-binding cassette domain-containing protein [Janibacter cremeus]